MNTEKTFQNRFQKLGIVALLVFASGMPLAQAQIKVGVVSFQRALTEVKKAKTIKANFQKEVDQRKKSLEAEEKELQKTQEEIQKSAAVLSDEAKMKKAQDFQKKVMAYQAKLQQSQSEFQKKELELVQPLITQMRELIPGIARKQNLDLVLENSAEAVVYAVTRVDITEELIKEFDAKFK